MRASIAFWFLSAYRSWASMSVHRYGTCQAGDGYINSVLSSVNNSLIYPKGVWDHLNFLSRIVSSKSVAIAEDVYGMICLYLYTHAYIVYVEIVTRCVIYQEEAVQLKVAETVVRLQTPTLAPTWHESLMRCEKNRWITFVLLKLRLYGCWYRFFFPVPTVNSCCFSVLAIVPLYSCSLYFHTYLSLAETKMCKDTIHRCL